MLKRPLLIFALITGALLGGAFGFLQSRTFAGLARGFLEKSVPPELGVRGNFREFGIQLFPPAVTISEPELKLAPVNLFSLPADSVIRARKIGVSFQPLQMLTGRVELSEVRITGGEIELQVAPGKSKPAAEAKKRALKWDQLVQIQVRSLVLEDSRVSLRWLETGTRLLLETREIALGRSGRAGDAVLSLHGMLASLEIEDRRISNLEVHASIHPDRIDVDSLSAELGLEGFPFKVGSAGRIEGSLLDFDSLKAELKVNASGDLGAMLPKYRGGVTFQGLMRTDLLHLQRSFRFDGKAVLEQAVVAGWKVNRAELEGLFESVGQWSDARVAVQSGRVDLASGSLAVGRVLWRPRQETTLKLPVRLDGVVLEDLLGPYASTVGNLSTRLSGSLDLEFKPFSSKFQLSANARLSAPQLSLFSSAGTRESDLILRATQPRIEGSFTVESTRFTPVQLEVLFPGSRFRVGGEVSWTPADTQWDLQFGGPVDLKDLESLGGSKILGKGNLHARVHGAASGGRLALDFDTDLEAAEYIQLRFGFLKGRISLSDGMQLLHFHRVQARSGVTPYQVDGTIDFRKPGKMALGFEMPGGRAEDLLRILSPLTSRLSWFPQSLRGRVKVRGTVGGNLSLKGMDIQAQLEGSNLSWLGEHVRALKFRGGFQGGRYWAEDLIAIKRSGSLLGKVSFGPDEDISWRLRSQNFSLGDLDWIIRLDVPMSGDLALQSEGGGKLDRVDSSTQVRVTRVGVRGKGLPDSNFSLQSKQGSFKLDGNGLGGQLKLVAQHDAGSQSRNQFSAHAEGLDFTPLLILLNPRLASDSALQGNVSGKLELLYRGDAIEQSSGSLVLEQLQVAKQGASFRSQGPVSAKIEGGTLNLPEARLVSAAGNALVARVATRSGEWSSRLSGELDLSILEFFIPPVLHAEGTLALDFALAGKLSSPELAGGAELRSGSIRVNGLDSPLERISGRVQARKNKWVLSAVQADLAQGRVSGGGQVLLFADRLPEIDLSVSLADNRLKAYPFQFIKVREGRIRLSGSQLPYEVSGSIVVDEALSREKLSSAGQGIALKTSLYAPPTTADGLMDFPLLKLKLDVSADSGLRFQNEFADVEMKAAITLVNTIEAPRVLGRAELVPGQGKISFKEHVFQIQSAQVNFDNPSAIDPRFELIANTEVSGTKIQLFTSGTAGSYKIDLSSNPVLPESEILSLLTLGRTSEDSRRLRSTNVSGVQQSEAASLILHSMDFNRDVKEKTGFQIGVGEAMDTMQGASAFRPQADVESTVAPKIVLKRQIGKQVDLSVGSTVGAGATSQREVNADLYLSPSVSVRGVWNYLEGTSTQDAGASQQGRTSFGLDLKLQKRFK